MSRSANRGECILTRLDNGLEVLLVPNPSAPALALDLWVRVGSADEKEDQAGLAHVVEHMLFKGTRRRAVGQVAGEIEDVGGEINAYTSFDQTVYSLTVASRFQELAVDLLADAAFCSAFDPGELEREKAVILEEIKRSQDLPHHVLGQLLFRLAYSSHPYGLPVIGHEASVSGFGRKDCMAFLRRWYRPDNMVLVAAGDLLPAPFLEVVRTHFSQPSRGGRCRTVRRPREPRQRGFRAAFEARDVNETYFDMAFRGPNVSHDDVAAVDLMTTILGQGEASRLQHRVKLDRNLVHAVGAGAYTPRDPGLVYVGGVVDPGLFEEAYAAIWEEMVRLCHEPVGRKELQRARENVEADFVYQKETVEGQAQKAGFFHVLCGDAQAEQSYLEAVARVEPTDLRRVAGKYLRPQTAALAAVHPLSRPPPWGGEGAGEAARRVVERARSYPRGPRSVRRGQVLCRRLAGGTRVLVKVNPQVPVVALRAVAAGGLRLEPQERGGAFRLLAESLTRGTRARSAYEIAHDADSCGGQLEGVAGRNTFGCKGEFLSKYLEDGLDLFCDVLLHPVFPDGEIDKVREDALAALRLRRDHPSSYAFRLFEEQLFPRHPYGRDLLGTPETLQNLNGPLLQEIYTEHFRPEEAVVAVTGDVDPDTVFEFLHHALEHLTRAPAQRDEPAPPEPITAARRRVVEWPGEQAHVLVGFHGTRVTSPDRFALRIANSILSGQGGRLFRHLRDEAGLAYAVNSACVEGIDPGYFAGYVACSPERAEEARDALLREFRRLATGDFGADEVAAAQRKMVGSFEIALQENSAQAAHLALDELFGFGHRSFRSFARSVFAVTRDAVVEVCRRYFREDGHASLCLLPRTPP